MPMRAHCFRIALVAVLGLPILPALACGPYFPNTFLDRPDVFLKTMPEGDFSVELAALEKELIAHGLLAETNWPAAEDGDDDDFPYDSTSQAEVADLKAALGVGRAALGTPDVILNYKVFRLCLSQFDMPDPLGQNVATPPAPRPMWDLDPPPGLPAEFDLYGRGAAAYRGGDTTKARREWVGILALPPAERRFRSTWAAFMLGKTWLRDNPARAVECFRMVRTLTRSGFADTLGLARESLGWEARAELDRCAFEKAALLYFCLLPSGDSDAALSLLAVARKTLSCQRFEEAARSPVLRGLVTACLVSRATPDEDKEDAEQWLKALEDADVKDVSGSDRLAWLAYRQGRMETAARWAARAASDSVIARWVRSKLLLREGRKAEAEALMKETVASLAKLTEADMPSFAATDAQHGYKPGSQPAGELAVLLMSDGHYREALDLLLRNGWWTDGAYVAERVLTLDELKAYVDEQWPEQKTDVARRDDEEACGAWRYYGDHPTAPRGRGVNQHIRYLLARRMARAGKLDGARPYYPETWRTLLEEYAKRLAQGHDSRWNDTVRAAALWRAARIMRHAGMELFGAEIGPDWRLYGGNYEPAYPEMRSPTNPPAAAMMGSDEAVRALSSAPKPDVRFHYRYAAANLAGEAARLMPDNSPVTAAVLCRAGLWLAGRDPKAADLFYKTLVKRCGRTSLGREADRRRWFPALEPLAEPIEE